MVYQKTSCFEPAPQNCPLEYPGKRPAGSYMFCGDHICGIDTEKITNRRKLLDIVCPDGEDRYLVVGYGSNANPAQLKNKFSCTDDKTHAVLKVTIKGYDVVYEKRFTSWGYVPATIIESKDTVMEAWANVLTKKQFEIMNRTEGKPTTYRLVECDRSFEIEGGGCISPIYLYVATGGAFCHNLYPVRLESIQGNNTAFDKMSQKEILDTFKNILEPDMSMEEFTKRLCHYDKRKEYKEKLGIHAGSKIMCKQDIGCNVKLISELDMYF